MERQLQLGAHSKDGSRFSPLQSQVVPHSSQLHSLPDFIA
jgi:hypothetical protein